MTKTEAEQLALGYAWASEDATGVKTALDGPATVGSLKFAEAFARGWDEYNSEVRHFMIPVSEAYRTWQVTNGQTIFRAYWQRPSVMDGTL